MREPGRREPPQAAVFSSAKDREIEEAADPGQSAEMRFSEKVIGRQTGRGRSNICERPRPVCLPSAGEDLFPRRHLLPGREASEKNLRSEFPARKKVSASASGSKAQNTGGCACGAGRRLFLLDFGFQLIVFFLQRIDFVLRFSLSFFISFLCQCLLFFIEISFCGIVTRLIDIVRGAGGFAV